MPALQVKEGSRNYAVQADVPAPTKVALREGTHALDRAVERLEDGWKRDALRAAWFLVDAVLRNDREGTVLAETVIQQRRGR